MRIAILLLLTLAANVRDLSSTLDRLSKDTALPGVAAAIVHADQLAALGSAGVRRIGDATKFRPDDLVHLGSDTKAMTALLIGKLIDQEQLRFDSSMKEIFPNLKPPIDPLMATVTVRDLLDHDAGLPHDLDWWALDRTKLPLPDQRQRAVAIALSSAPATPIGRFSYSNVSFVVLGAIIEAKTGKSWEEVIRKQIFQPLHMDSAGFGVPGTLGRVDQPWGHVRQNGKLQAVQADNAAVMAPAGGVHCSIVDWSKFISEVLRFARGRDGLVSAATFKQMITPPSGQQYAGGWIVTDRPWAGGIALTHAGSNTMWFADVWLAPAKDVAFLKAINDGSDAAAKPADDGIGQMIRFDQSAPPP